MCTLELYRNPLSWGPRKVFHREVLHRRHLAMTVPEGAAGGISCGPLCAARHRLRQELAAGGCHHWLGC